MNVLIKLNNSQKVISCTLESSDEIENAEKCGFNFSCGTCTESCQIQINIVFETKETEPKSRVKRNLTFENDEEESNIQSCTICGKSFIDSYYLQQHVKLFHIPVPNYTCDQCNKSFALKVSYRAHMNSHSTRYQCRLCSRCHQSKTALRKHLQSVHSTDLHEENRIKPPNFSCEICGKLYATKSALNVHGKSHATPEFECGLCGKKFIRKSVMLKHLLTIHRRENHVLTCPKCPENSRKFVSKVHLSDHLGKVHSTKRFACEICAVQFKQKGTLKEHLKIHTGEKEFACTLCTKSFRTKTLLKTHAVVHTEEKNFTCRFCPQRFTRKSSVKVHEKIHTRQVRRSNTDTPLKIQMEEQEPRDSDYDF